MFSVPFHHFSHHDSFAGGMLESYPSHGRFSTSALPAFMPNTACDSAVDMLSANNANLPWGSPLMSSTVNAHVKSKRQHPPKHSGPLTQVRRRRVSRACDQCNQLRTKCDGQHPCAHCIELNLSCEYMREKKKRGKASRKDLAQRATTASATTCSNSRQTYPKPQTPSEPSDASKGASRASSLLSDSFDNGSSYIVSTTGTQVHVDTQALRQASEPDDVSRRLRPSPFDTPLHTPTTTLNEYHGISPDFDEQHLHFDVSSGGISPLLGDASDHLHCGSNGPSLGLGHQNGTSFENDARVVLNTTTAMGAFPAVTVATSPSWGIALTSSSAGNFQTQHPFAGSNCLELRYPVLEPLIPHLMDSGILPITLACDLLDFYFSSSSSAQLHPISPYVLGFVSRKKSILHPSRPRACQPALLASMLWVAAQSSDAALLSSSPSARASVCQRLLDLTLRLLKPLIHASTEQRCTAAETSFATYSLGELGAAIPSVVGVEALTENSPLGCAGHLDDVATYIHLATVASASEYKGASLRWWNAAWSLARELKLGRELSPNQSGHHSREIHGAMDVSSGVHTCGGPSCCITEEEREERRRTWWLLYMVDRHLALCYNRPLSLLDVECEGLLQPMNDMIWQDGDLPCCSDHPGHRGASTLAFGSQGTPDMAGNAARYMCRGPGIFGFFLPLMTILGEIVDLHHARNHPRLGHGARGVSDWVVQAEEIRLHIHTYEQSLASFRETYLSDLTGSLMDEQGHAVGITDESSLVDTNGRNCSYSSPMLSGRGTHGSSRLTDGEMQSNMVVAYGTHVVHVLHILLAGKWDPISLLDDHDLWISSPSFFEATNHAVSAADAISSVLKYDPGLEFMPFFFGIYLLQGSFLLLLMADKLGPEASPNVVEACETIVRAHEACVVTLNTEYQRNFSTVMRSALAVVQGRATEDGEEQRQRWRELLGLYRWTGDGTGLAL